MVKISKVLILLFVIGGMIVFGLPDKTFHIIAQKKETVIKEKVLPKLIDRDKNKIFDNLEELLEGKPNETEFDLIIVLQSLSCWKIARNR